MERWYPPAEEMSIKALFLFHFPVRLLATARVLLRYIREGFFTRPQEALSFIPITPTIDDWRMGQTGFRTDLGCTQFATG